MGSHEQRDEGSRMQFSRWSVVEEGEEAKTKGKNKMETERKMRKDTARGRWSFSFLISVLFVCLCFAVMLSVMLSVMSRLILGATRLTAFCVAFSHDSDNGAITLLGERQTRQLCAVSVSIQRRLFIGGRIWSNAVRSRRLAG